MTTLEEHAARVAAGIAWLDEHLPGWKLTVSPVARGRLSIALADLAEEHAPPQPETHDWMLARGWTIDYSSLGYPSSDGGPPRAYREGRAYAELELAWWVALIETRPS